MEIAVAVHIADKIKITDVYPERGMLCNIYEARRGGCVPNTGISWRG